MSAAKLIQARNKTIISTLYLLRAEPGTPPRPSLLFAGAAALIFAMGCSGLFAPAAGPEVVATASWPGASPIEVDRAVALALSAAVNPLPGVDTVSTWSGEGQVQLTVGFDSDVDLWTARQHVVEALGDLSTLPSDVERPVVWAPGADGMVVALANDPPGLVDIVEDALTAIPGVAAVRVDGNGAQRILIEVDAARLAAFAVTMRDIESALITSNSIAGSASGYVIRAAGKVDDIDDLTNMVVGTDLVRLGDIATIQTDRHWDTVARLDGVPVALLTVVNQPDAQPQPQIREALDTLGLPADAIKVLPPPTVTVTTQGADGPRQAEELGRAATTAGADRVWWISQVSDGPHDIAGIAVFATGADPAALRQEMAGIPGIDARIRSGAETVAIAIEGQDAEALLETRTQLRAVAAQDETVLNTAVLPGWAQPELEIRWEREALARRGLTVHDVQRDLRYALGGREVTTLIHGREMIPVVLRSSSGTSVDEIRTARIGGVPLFELATLEQTIQTPILRLDGQQSMILELEVEGTTDVPALLHAVELPPGVTLREVPPHVVPARLWRP
jgi:multidrug efflux pump subunit AcrB